MNWTDWKNVPKCPELPNYISKISSMNFAMNTLINKDDYDKFIEKNVLNINAIKKFARTQGVLPGIVIGRIQNDTKEYSFLAKYKEKYVWE